MYMYETKQDPMKTQLYKCPLPETCVSFSSSQGKVIFKEALTSGYMECYFKLSEQFRTPYDPALCGQSCLVMLLNAFQIDPKKIWKSPWRWYHETTLTIPFIPQYLSCESLTFEQFTELAVNNDLEVSSTYVDEHFQLEKFRETLLRVCKHEELFMIISYCRRTLCQVGDGHFSPIGGYNKDRDLVLILDTARYMYQSHWIPVKLLFEAMQTKDACTGKSRGYIVISYNQKRRLN